jgi:hypothetical protein
MINQPEIMSTFFAQNDSTSKASRPAVINIFPKRTTLIQNHWT